jgi:hypothetical protein
VTGRFAGFDQGVPVAKDKKKDKKDKGAKKKGKAKGSALPGSARAAARKIQDWSQNPLIADVVAAALVAAAAAMKDSRKAQRLAAEAGDELEKLSKKGAERGNAMWQLALDIGRRSLEELADSGRSGGKSRRR